MSKQAHLISAMGAIFRKGKVIKTVKESEILPALLEEINKIKSMLFSNILNQAVK